MTSVGGRRPNRRGEGVRLRGEILAAAAAILDETGDEHAVTLRAVARHAGIAAPSIYAHFPDRQAILLEAVRQAFAELAAHLQAAGGSDPDPVLQLWATSHAYLDHALERPQRYRLMFAGVWSGADAVAGGTVSLADVTGLGAEALRVLTTRLQACVDAGRSTSTDAEADAVALWLGLHGLANQRAVAPGFPWPSDIAERVVAPLAGLRPVVDDLSPVAARRVR